MTASRLRLYALLALTWPLAALAGTLVINLNSADPAPRAAWDAAIRRFEREHPQIHVRLNLYDHESYKRALRNWLTGVPPDVVFWFAGNRMRQFVTPGLLDDVSELYTPAVMATLMLPRSEIGTGVKPSRSSVGTPRTLGVLVKQPPGPLRQPFGQSSLPKFKSQYSMKKPAWPAMLE